MLVESPTHVINHLRNAIAAGDFSQTNAYLYLGVALIAKGLKNPTPAAIDALAHEPALTTAARIKRLVTSANKQDVTPFLQEFTADNTTRLLNQLKMWERHILSLYSEFGIQHYTDK